MMSTAKNQRTPNILLRQARELRSWSQSYVAQAVDTNAYTVSRWESGTNFPSSSYRIKLCKLFERSAIELGLVRQNLGSISVEGTKADTALTIFDSAIPHLPSPALVGRKKLLVHLKRVLTAEQAAQTLALKGLPGVGKTALAVTLAHDKDVRAAFTGGILWAGLGDQPNVAHLLSRWGKLLGLTSAQTEKLTTVEAMTKALRRVIGTRPMLIVLDDAWSIEVIVALQIGGPRCTYLVTTRQAEVALHVAGNATITVLELSVHKGVTLLTQVAPACKSILNDVQKLVRAVGGLPLALILMGGYIQAETHNLQQRRLLQAVGRLSSAEERLSLAQPLDPTAGLSSIPVGTSFSLQAVIDLSNRHLSEEARSTLRLLAVFPPKPNTFQEDAALAVCATSTNALDELTDAGLVESQGQGYYTLHQTIADYAKTVNDMSNEAREAAKKRMVAFFIQFVVAHCQHYTLLEHEAQNITTALDLAYEQENFSAFARGVNAFAIFWIARGQHSNAEKYLYTAQCIAESIDDARSLAITGIHLARMAELRGEFRYADVIYESRLAAARQSKDVEVISALLTCWSELMIHRGEHSRAKPYLAESMTLARSLHQRSLMAGLFKSLGEVAYAHGEYQAANDHYEEGLQLARANEDSETISALLQNLGAYAVSQHNYRLAHQRYEEGLFYARSIKHQERISALLMNQGFLAIQEHDYALAKKLSYECLELAYEGESRFRIASVLQNLGIIETLQGHYVCATQYFNASYEIACDIKHAWVANETLCEWGELHLKRGEWTFAADKFKRALKAARTMETPELIAIALFGLARAAAGRAEYEQAYRLGKESFELYEKMRDPRDKVVNEWLKRMPPPPH